MPPIRFTDFTALDEFGVAVDRLCFGQPIMEACAGSKMRTSQRYRFRPGQMFAVVWHRWRKNGRQHRAIAIIEALGRAAEGSWLPGISRPVRVHAMTDQHGPAGQGGGVDRWLLLIESIEQKGMDPTRVPAAYWRLSSFQIMLQRRPLLPQMITADKRVSHETSKNWPKLDHQLHRVGRGGNHVHRGQSPDRD